MSKNFIFAHVRSWFGRGDRNWCPRMFAIGLLMLPLCGMQAEAESLPSHKVDIRVADTGHRTYCTLQAHCSIAHGSLNFLLAVQIADHCIVVRTRYTTGRAS